MSDRPINNLRIIVKVLIDRQIGPQVGQRLLNCSHANLICCQLGFASIECLSLFPRQMPGLLLRRELSGRGGLLT